MLLIILVYLATYYLILRTVFDVPLEGLTKRQFITKTVMVVILVLLAFLECAIAVYFQGG